MKNTKITLENKLKARELLAKIYNTNYKIEDLLSDMTNAINGLLLEKISYELWCHFYNRFKELLFINIMDQDFIIDFMRLLEHATIIFKNEEEEQDYWNNIAELGTIYEEHILNYER